MGDCGSCGSGAGPFAEGLELVEFVYNAHGGGLRDHPIPGGGLQTNCQGCGMCAAICPSDAISIERI